MKWNCSIYIEKTKKTSTHFSLFKRLNACMNTNTTFYGYKILSSVMAIHITPFFRELHSLQTLFLTLKHFFVHTERTFRKASNFHSSVAPFWNYVFCKHIVNYLGWHMCLIYCCLCTNGCHALWLKFIYSNLPYIKIHT